MRKGLPSRQPRQNHPAASSNGMRQENHSGEASAWMKRGFEIRCAPPAAEVRQWLQCPTVQARVLPSPASHQASHDREHPQRREGVRLCLLQWPSPDAVLQVVSAGAASRKSASRVSAKCAAAPRYFFPSMKTSKKAGTLRCVAGESFRRGSGLQLSFRVAFCAPNPAVGIFSPSSKFPAKARSGPRAQRSTKRSSSTSIGRKAGGVGLGKVPVQDQALQVVRRWAFCRAARRRACDRPPQQRLVIRNPARDRLACQQQRRPRQITGQGAGFRGDPSRVRADSTSSPLTATCTAKVSTAVPSSSNHEVRAAAIPSRLHRAPRASSSRSLQTGPFNLTVTPTVRGTGRCQGAAGHPARNGPQR